MKTDVKSLTTKQYNNAVKINDQLAAAGITNQILERKIKLDNGQWCALQAILLNERKRPILVSNASGSWKLTVDKYIYYLNL